MATQMWIKETMLDVIDAVVANYAQHERTSHLGHKPLPSREAVVEILHDLMDVLYPGYWRRQNLHTGNVQYHVGDVIDRVYERLTQQVRRAFRYELPAILVQDSSPVDLESLADQKVAELLKTLPRIRDLLAQDVQAAFEGDPAARSYHEVIFCYPGLEAVSIHRIAHELFVLGVPLIPRMMSEYAHQRTGIDIHPGARIQPGFFIDHGTGVVIGETCEIGSNVKLYQGVTLGALSFPRDAEGNIIRGVKRHPTLENDVVVYANATILGGQTVIGHHAVIGSSVWLTQSVTPYTVDALEKPQLRLKGPNWNHADFYSI
jgi:serine O-acetyltransferase